MSKLPPHIEKRRRRYYAVLAIPKPLRKHYPGKSPGKLLYRLVQSLETDSLTIAKRRSAPIIAGWKSDFARLRDEPDDAAYFRRQLQKARNDIERASIMRQIDMEAENRASPTVATYAGQPDHEGEAAYREATEAAEEAATAFYERATGEVVGLTDHMENWLDRQKVTNKTKDMHRAAIKRLEEECPTIADVTHEAVQKWVDGLGVSPATTQRMLSAVRGYWRYLQRPDVKVVPKEFQPFADLDIPRQKNGANGKRRAFAPGQVVRLLISTTKRRDEQLRDLIRLAMWTGARIEEICQLRTENVHTEYIDITDAKTEAGIRQVPIHKTLKRELKRMVDESSDGYVITGLDTVNKYGSRSSAIGKRFGRLKTSMGFGPELVFHSIRGTVATLLEDAGVPENVAADILGHEKPNLTYGVYSGGTSLKVKAEALNRIGYGPQRSC